METFFSWLAPIATIVASFMVAANAGARITGLGFIVYSIGAIGWIGVAWLSGQTNLLVQNLILMAINILGIWRWLGIRARYEKGAEIATEETR